MDKEEIMRYIELGSTKSVCINREMSNLYPGFVVDIIIMNDAIVNVEYNSYGYNEGGLEFKLYYPNYDKLLYELSNYVGKPIEQWENISKSGWYPKLNKSDNFEEAANKLKTDLINNTIWLPNGWIKCEIPEGYWKDLVDGKIDI